MQAHDGLDPSSAFVPSSFVDPFSLSCSDSTMAPSFISLPPSAPGPHLILGQMLNDIAKTASSAGDACLMGQNQEASSKVDELKLRILRVSEMLAIMSFNHGSFLPFPSPQITLANQHPLTFQQQPAVDISTHLNASDLSRKRGASDMEEQRTVKALKREPQDDIPIVHPPDIFAPTDAPSSSRPTTPPSAFPANHLIDPVKQQPPIIPEYSPFLPTAQSTVDFGSGITTPMASASPTFSDFHSPWGDAVASHHQLPLQALPVATPSATPSDPIAAFPAASEAPLQIQAIPQEVDVLTNPIGRISRSNSASRPVDTPYNFGGYDINPYAKSWSSASTAPSNSAPADPVLAASWQTDTSTIPTSPVVSDTPSSRPSTTCGTPTDDEEEGNTSEDGDSNHSRTDKKLSPLSEIPSTFSSASDVPQEYRAEVDRIFFAYLNQICSNLDATDSKGEPIHQTLMAKKMQKLDESPDFRPFKFRIQAFTLAFLEELARQGYPEEKIPMKKIRNYLWRQPFILRFNEDGKKAKSKGNHIWNIEAKKAGENKWEFRPFHRKLAGNPPSVAYCGLKWSWTPRVWDPQASFQNVPVKFSSPSLPSWLSWKEDVLSGIPPPDAEDYPITVNANYVLDGQEGQLSQTFTITIAPVSAAAAAAVAVEAASHPPPRRPSMAGDAPRRSTSDSFLCQTSKRFVSSHGGSSSSHHTPRSKTRSNTTAALTTGYTPNKPVPASSPPEADPDPVSESPDKRVIRVLQQAAQKVIMEAESQLVFQMPEQQETLEDLAKQKHVLDLTVDAYDRELSGQSHLQTRQLAVAAQHVVVQAAHTVIADRTGGTVVPESEVTAIQSVTVSELSDATQDAIAEAVKMKGIATNDVDIIVTATSILKARAPGSPTSSLEALPPQSSSPTSPNAAITSPLSSTPGVSSTRVNIGPGYAPNLSVLPEYV